MDKTKNVPGNRENSKYGTYKLKAEIVCFQNVPTINNMETESCARENDSSKFSYGSIYYDKKRIIDVPTSSCDRYDITNWFFPAAPLPNLTVYQHLKTQKIPTLSRWLEIFASRYIQVRRTAATLKRNNNAVTRWSSGISTNKCEARWMRPSENLCRLGRKSSPRERYGRHGTGISTGTFTTTIISVSTTGTSLHRLNH